MGSDPIAAHETGICICMDTYCEPRLGVGFSPHPWGADVPCGVCGVINKLFKMLKWDG